MTNSDQLILAAWTCDESIYPRANLAILDMTPDVARGYLGLMDVVTKLKVGLPVGIPLYCLTLWDTGLIFLDAWEYLEDEGHCKEDFDPPILSPYPMPYEEEDVIRMDCVTMRVQPDEIDWTGYIKHTSVVVDTASITRSFLVDYLKGKED